MPVKKAKHRFYFYWITSKIPHNLGAIIRTANLAGAHGVIVPKTGRQG